MQTIWFEIIPLHSDSLFYLRDPCGSRRQASLWIPSGSTISVNTGDPNIATWPKGDLLNPLNKQHYQIRADKTYTAESINLYPPGFKFDPHGAIGIIDTPSSVPQVPVLWAFPRRSMC